MIKTDKVIKNIIGMKPMHGMKPMKDRQSKNGFITRSRFSGMNLRNVKCADCMATGKNKKGEPCRYCDGTGYKELPEGGLNDIYGVSADAEEERYERKKSGKKWWQFSLMPGYKD